MARPIGTGGAAPSLTQDEVRRVDKMLVGTTWELRNRALLYLGLGGGFRVGEMVGLRVSDVANGKVRDQVVLEKHSTKSRKSRTVFLSPQAQLHVQRYLDSRPNRQPDEPLFPSQKNPRKGITPNAAVQLLKKMFVVAGVDQASSHSLRKSHANALRQNGVDLSLVQSQLGHSSLALTQLYFSTTPVERARAVAGLKF